MSHLITVEQAVAVVNSVYKRACHSRDYIIHGLRALPPAEPTAKEVERVARALYEVDKREGDCEWNELDDEGVRDDYRPMAEAAIAAMRSSK
jgi:hypothetical protein